MTSGFRERSHTADWALEVWARDEPELLATAAMGMYSLMGAHLRHEPPVHRRLDLEAPDMEGRLVCFLTELLYLGELEGEGFTQFDIHISGVRLLVEMEGAPLASIAKEIKAVTYHNLVVQNEQDGLRTIIVFDV
jgi:SHS2 domain-containing protein